MGAWSKKKTNLGALKKHSNNITKNTAAALSYGDRGHLKTACCDEISPTRERKLAQIFVDGRFVGIGAPFHSIGHAINDVKAMAGLIGLYG